MRLIAHYFSMFHAGSLRFNQYASPLHIDVSHKSFDEELLVNIHSRMASRITNTNTTQ